MILSALARVGPVSLACCSYVERVIGQAYGSAVARAPGSMWNLWHPDVDPWSPVTAAVQAGVGVSTSEPVPGAWHVAQGWRTIPSAEGSGHTWFLFVPAQGGDDVLVADSVLTRPAAPWYTKWSALKREFSHGIALARLRRLPAEP